MKFSHSLSVCSFSKFLLKSPNKMISFPSLETLSIKLSNLSTNSTFEFGGRYIFPTKKGLLLPTVISNQMHSILFVF